MINSRFAVAVHILSILALKERETISSEAIAGSVNTNPVVIRRILGDLRRARLVVIQPGAGGGARLARDAAKITLLEIYQAVEDTALFALHPQQPNPDCEIGANIQAVLEVTFDRAEAAMFRTLAGTTVDQILHDVLNRAREAS